MKSIVAFLVLSGTVAAQQRAAQGVNFYSIDREIALGQQLAAGVAAKMTVVHDPALDAYVAKLGKTIAAQADGHFPYTFTIFDDRKPWVGSAAGFATPADRQTSEPTAFAGGPIFIPLSLLSNAPNEETFAFELAHAVSHVALRHATRNATKTDLMQAGTDTVVRTLPASTASETVQNGVELGVPLAQLAFARANELEADYMATGILANVGYDPLAVIPCLEAQLTPQPKVLSPWPASERRVNTIKAALEKLPAHPYAANTGEFEAMKARAGSQ
jgi:predicted Zn-dependent protease